MSEHTGLAEIDPFLERAKVTTNPRGNLVRRVFHSTERYLFDFGLDGGWKQFDTTTDAWYFGIWVNPTRLRTLSYVEGDVFFTQCENAESYDREIANLCAAYEPGAAFTSIDLDDEKKLATLTRHFQDRDEFFLDAERGAKLLEVFLAEREEQDS